MTTISNVTNTPVVIGTRRGGPDRSTLRQDRWWIQQVVTVTVLTAFVVYSTWAVFVNKDYYVGESLHRDLISPFFSPCVTASCATGAVGHSFVINWWHITPALLIMLGPLSFRGTCYYYRKAYYRGYWNSPPACAVGDRHTKYTGESRFPLLIQNAHRYFFIIGLFFNTILTIDAVMAFRMPGQGGIGVSWGTIILVLNATFLWSYSLSCHAARHLIGGSVNMFSKHPIRHRLWKIVSALNAKHMQIAWVSLIFVAFTDLYVRLVASGTISDLKLF